MARSLSGTLTTAQKGTGRVPYIRIFINSVDYTGRLLFIEHIEEAYRDRAIIVLRNNDRALDPGTVDLRGYEFEVGYGFTTGAGNEYVGDGTNEPGPAALFVKNQQTISAEGQVVCQLYCEGMWMYAREQRIRAYGSAPYFVGAYDGTTDTVYDIIEDIIEGALGWTLDPKPSPDDGILDTFKPVFDINQIPYESAASLLYRLITMTKCYFRLRANNVWTIVYPQTSDSVNQTFYSDQEHYFLEYMEKYNEVVPNRIVVYANNPELLDPWPEPVMTGDTGAYSGNYTEVLQPYVVASITVQADASNRAAAIKTRLDSESLAGRLIVPHDCGMELYDKVSVVDTRGG
ncbi:hypothetical protein LCGC14_0392760 [marine sediment metagenome]|uniref:Uncharacterized protein n=1 Tax=marine sediment metagenome TaxID=412755 RepID=A0A0F9SZ17_9ZZZZ